MKKIFCVRALLTVVFLTMAVTASASDSRGGNAFLMATTQQDQKGVALTIYNVNLGLVKDQRETRLAKGIGELQFMDVAAEIIPASVAIKSLVAADSLEVLEQNYEYDLLNPQKLLDKYVGKDVKLYQKNPYTEREEIVTATLLSTNGGPVFKIGNEITFGHPGRVIFPGVPENLISKPTLVWLLANSLAKPQRLEASYLTNGINWRADYVLTLNERDNRAELVGWVTIDNKSGATYQNATLKLVAGDINRVREEPRYRDMMLKAARAELVGAPQFKEEAFFEYHIYALQRPTTIKDNQSKQIRLVQAGEVPVKKELVFSGERSFFVNPQGETLARQKVGVFVEMANRKENHLGIPLPKGTVRVFKQDGDGSLQFVGEDTIDHTPQDEKVRINLGEAFDVVGSRKQTDWKKLAADTYEAAFEISLRNHKKEEVVVKVREPIPGDWTILSSSHTFTKTEAHIAEFAIAVPRDREVKLTYRVRMRY